MEQVLAYAVRHIKENIPRLILERAFQHNTTLDLFGDAVHVNLDNAIETNVLKNSVCLDVQLIASKHEVISLEGLNALPQSDGGYVINVPKSYSGNREIISVTAVHFTTAHHPVSSALGSSNVTDKMARITDGYRQRSPGMSTDCEMIAPNVIYVGSSEVIGPPQSAEVELQIDNNLSHVPHHAYTRFGRLALEKAKMLIRNRLRIKIAEGAISRGMELGVIREIIDEFAGSDENYNDLLAQWRRTEVYLDPKRKLKHIVTMMPK